MDNAVIPIVSPRATGRVTISSGGTTFSPPILPSHTAMPFHNRARRVWSMATALLSVLLGGLLAVGLQPSAMGGGGAENLFLVVNAASAESIAVANAYASLRGVPPINVLFLDWQGSRQNVGIAEFRRSILGPIKSAIEARRLAPQIDMVVYSCDFPWRIDFAEELPKELATTDKFPSGSLTGMTMLHAAVDSGVPAWLDPASNRYWRPLDGDGMPRETVGFRGWYGWGPQGELLEAGGVRYLLSAMLGVTDGRGNTVPEIIRYLSTAAAADGTRPKGTIYFVTNGDVRTKTRSGVFDQAVRSLAKLGVAAEIVKGTLPVSKRDVAGLMTGTADFDWPRSNSTIVPGAICENLTSYGGIFTRSAGQTPLSEFLRAGAAGSSGTVIEPYALQAKFPHASIQLHYARGASLAEAFYQSVHSPYQLLVVGDPLCRPWATIPEVVATIGPDGGGIEPGKPWSGVVEITPRSTVAGGGDVDRFELFIDGLRYARCSAGERFTLDTTKLADGHHDLRVVAIESSPIESQGRWGGSVTFANGGRSLSLSASPARVRLGDTIAVKVAGEDIDGTIVYAMGRVLGRASGSESTIQVPADLLGLGKVTLRATGRKLRDSPGSVNAAPVTVEVVGGK